VANAFVASRAHMLALRPQHVAVVLAARAGIDF